MKNKKYLLGLIIGLLVPILLIGIMVLFFQKKIENDVSIEVSAMEITDMNGNQILLDSINDNGILINFWATWCAPCIKEMPIFDEISKTQNVAVIAISDQNMDLIKSFAGKKDYSFVIAQYGFTGEGKVNVLPTTILVDEKSQIIWSKVGSISKEELLEAINILNR